MWNLMWRNGNPNLNGIFDPRAYYFFDLNQVDQWVPFPNDPPTAFADGGDPYKYPDRDLNYNIYGEPGDTCWYSPVNYYLIRDMDYQPDILLSGAEMLFIRAEALMRGIGVNKDENAAYSPFRDGIEFSVKFWKDVMDNSKIPSTGVPFSANVTVPQDLDNFDVEFELFNGFNNGDEQTKLRLIYSQCFIDMFRQPQEAWALMKRTGKTPHEGVPSQVYRFPIPQSEISYNQSNYMTVFGGGDNMNQRLWWMN
jgi:hypothetical protein